ncbi:MAG: endonuclease/exonuclease/phosphatase family protein [Pseudomonadota bacterium]
MLTAAFTVATVFDSLHRYLELFSHFKLQYLAASLLLAALLAALRRPRYATLMLLMSGINSAYVLPWYTGAPELGERETVSLLHVNVLASNRDMTRLLEHIERADPDLVFVQELTPEHTRMLRALDLAYPYRLLEARQDPFGLGVWSKQPLHDASVLELPPRGHPSLKLGIEFDGQPVTIYSTHPLPPMGRRFYEDRNVQLSAVGELVAATPGSVILTGDLNISVWAEHYRKLEEQTGLDNVRQGYGVLPSWPVFFPVGMIAIDHALVSSDLAAVDVRTLSSVGSDHLPLLVEIARR